ncbi:MULTISPECIES: DUF3783 domain-containing protein [Coprobacillaceae]|uniref:DUF3783 domain-containing protein n=1 Tax=Coprobacillaceae TaxID=2810280 RepID=UPI000E52EAFC|nr:MULTISPECIES: DUF3783 domain-containing protein [Coprobacillaceae]RHM59538.1 DUF3783 domain-containing protein [Coprobacillus sp. AF33-1AC]RHS91987.1 DUF3783 domain-containing protein [Erysipelatoclostridium sp. AM42-17]
MEETVLLYNIDKTEPGKAMISILKKLDVKVVIVKTKDLMNPVGYLLGNSDYKRSTDKIKEVPQDEMMVLSGFDDKQVDVLLQIFQKANIPFIPLKAIVTETNIEWSFLQLLNNVKNEYMHLTGMNKDISML